MNNDAQMMVTMGKTLFEERYTATLNERNPDFCDGKQKVTELNH